MTMIEKILLGAFVWGLFHFAIQRRTREHQKMMGERLGRLL